MRKTFCIFLVSLLFFCSIIPLSADVFDEAVIEGLYLEKVEEAQVIYSLKANKATFGNKRIGFFSIALIKVINLEDGYFRLYDDGCVVKTEYFDKAVYEITTKRLLDEQGNVIFSE